MIVANKALNQTASPGGFFIVGSVNNFQSLL
jgi:hypothetical protein